MSCSGGSVWDLLIFSSSQSWDSIRGFDTFEASCKRCAISLRRVRNGMFGAGWIATADTRTATGTGCGIECVRGCDAGCNGYRLC
jgi:hypothetical protein